MAEVCDIIQGQSPPGSTYNSSGKGMPFFQGKAEFGELHPTVRKWCTAPTKIAETGDILISIRAPVGPTNVAADRCCIGRGLAALRSREGISQLYLLHYLRRTETELAGTASGSTFGAISGAQLAQHPVPLAPLCEQHRIVAEIEVQFTRLDASVSSLSKATRTLIACRKALIQAGVQGRLTGIAEAARQWQWVPIGDVAETSPSGVTDGPFGSNLKTEHYTESGPRVIRLQNIGDGKFIDQRACISEAHFQRLQKHAVLPGDLLIAALGSELPRCCLSPENLGPAIVKADCIRFRPDRTHASPRYLCHALNSQSVRKETQKRVHGVGRPRLNLSEIKSIRVPLPPLSDQEEIVEAIEDNLSLIDSVEAAVRTSLRRATLLREAILKKAFEGNLVPQERDDEPAAVLLERIRTARPSLVRARAIR